MALVGSSIVSYGGTAASTFFFPIEKERFLAEEETLAEDDQHDAGGRRRRGALFCRAGTWLEVLDDVTQSQRQSSTHVHGTHDGASRFSVLEFISVAMGLVSIRGVAAQRFVCMDDFGKLYSAPTSNYSEECVFYEDMMENYYNLYSSCKYGSAAKPWFIELRRNGKPRRGPNTKKRRKASHFLVVHYDLPRKPKPGENPSDTVPFSAFLASLPRRLQNVDLSTLVVASLMHQPPSHPYFRPSVTTSPHRISRLMAKVVRQDDNRADDANKKRRRKQHKGRREERLQREERQRKERQEELKRLRAMELRRTHHRLQPLRSSLLNSLA